MKARGAKDVILISKCGWELCRVWKNIWKLCFTVSARERFT